MSKLVGGAVTNTAPLASPFTALDSRNSAMDYENQQMLERIFNAHQTMPLLRKQFSDKGVTSEFLLDLLSQMVLHRQANVVTMVGLLSRHFDGDLQETADALMQACEQDFVDFNTDTNNFVIRYDVDDKTKQLVDQYRYMPPMIVPPRKLTHNMSSGYLTITADSLILRDNHHNGDICLDSLNKFNAIPLRINEEVVKRIRNTWKGLESQKEGESITEYKKRLESFEKYERDSFWIIALMLEMGNQFWLTHKVDKRGRTYAQGYHVNTQGNTWNKACVEFYDEEVINWSH
jgi:hypothetical protein